MVSPTIQESPKCPGFQIKAASGCTTGDITHHIQDCRTNGGFIIPPPRRTGEPENRVRAAARIRKHRMCHRFLTNKSFPNQNKGATTIPGLDVRSGRSGSTQFTRTEPSTKAATTHRDAKEPNRVKSGNKNPPSVPECPRGETAGNSAFFFKRPRSLQAIGDPKKSAQGRNKDTRME